MKLKRDQRMTLMKELMESKPIRKICEAQLGLGHVPDAVADFNDDKPEVRDKVEAFLSHIMDQCLETFQEVVKRPREPRQKDLFEGGKEEREAYEREKAAVEAEKAKKEAEAKAKKEAQREKKERAKVAKGDAAGRQRAVDAVRGKDGKGSKKKAAKKKASKKKTAKN